ncbi:MAG TPA: NAD-dependent protein deacetylase [Woeseiaceae bacterium]
MTDPERDLKVDGPCRDAAEVLQGELLSFFETHARITVLTGAGCSTESGIPDYRDDAGNWKHRKPVQFAEFVSSVAIRQRYWAQSFAGWSRISGAKPTSAHVALADLERAGRIKCLITQNVDRLHFKAGNRNVIDLHGVLHRIRCLGCATTCRRQEFQEQLERFNPHWHATVLAVAPDGDSQLVAPDFSGFFVPDCEVCGGILKPDVVFFGEAVPAERVEKASDAVRHADALLVAGSSLMVFSGFRLVRMAKSLGKPIAIINRGKTRADDLASHRFTGNCGKVLSAAADYFTRKTDRHARGLGGSL